MMTTAPAGSLSAEELATAMRSGLEARRFFRPLPPVQFPPPPGDAAFPRLSYYCRPVDLPATRSRIPIVGWLFRLARMMAHRLVSPWLEHQAEFNTAVAEYIRAIHPYLHESSARHAAALREIVPAYQATHARLSECLYDVHRLRAGDPGAPPRSARPTDPVDVIEGLFLHTRIGPPPGRVLVAGPATLAALDLASLGFQTVLHSATYEQPEHPGLQLVTPRQDRLPFPDGSFDVVVAFGVKSLQSDELVRVLAPGGKWIGSQPADPNLTDAGAPEGADLGGFITELAFAVRAGHGWTLEREPSIRTERVLWTAVKE